MPPRRSKRKKASGSVNIAGENVGEREKNLECTTRGGTSNVRLTLNLLLKNIDKKKKKQKRKNTILFKTLQFLKKEKWYAYIINSKTA